MKSKRANLRAVLAVGVSANRRVLLAQHLASVTLIDQQIAELDGLIAEQREPFQAQIAALRSVGGIEAGSVAAIFAELGADPKAFQDAHHAAAWAGLAPGQRESASKRKRTGAREGNSYLKRILVQAAVSRSRRKKHGVGGWFRSLQFKLAAQGRRAAARKPQGCSGSRFEGRGHATHVRRSPSQDSPRILCGGSRQDRRFGT